jgi:myo-inositol-1(or 4)-monophosphatase
MDPSGGDAGVYDVWLDACRRAVGAQRAIFAAHRGMAERTVYEGIGEGGDRTLLIDRLCEDAVFEQLERLHADGHEFTAVSEERGEVAFGDGPVRVVIDPIDGSMNARRTAPQHCLSFAVASADSMAAVEFGFIHDFGADEEFTAVRGSGALLDGEAVEIGLEPGLESVGFEVALPEYVIPAAKELSGKAFRIRVLGSIAIALAYTATARFDGMLTLKPCRSVDAAAGLLIVREAGGAVALAETTLEAATLGLDVRYAVIASRSPEDLATLVAAQAAV